ncbi:hypothetical protein OSTOST_16751, partial [Ostertagia ostertagi]
MLLQNNYDLVFLSESWLCSGTEMSSLLGVASSQFDHVRCDRTRKKGGGVLLLIRHSIPYNLVFKESVAGAYEIVVVDTYFGSHAIRFIVIYRTPSCSVQGSSLLLKAVSDFCSYNGPTLVLGDFNLPGVSWDEDWSDKSSSKDFVETFRSHKFTQLVRGPTRGKSCLDLVFCNSPQLVNQTKILPPIGTSDHATVAFQLNVSVLGLQDFKNADMKIIDDYLSKIDWIGSLGSVYSVNDKYETLLAILNDVIDRFVPIRKTTSGLPRLPSSTYLIFRVQISLLISEKGAVPVQHWNANFRAALTLTSAEPEEVI